MRRRLVLGTVVAAPLGLAACAPPAVKSFASLASAMTAIAALADAPARWRTTGTWSLAQTLNHAAQSIEYSMRGFPAPKSALFQATVGRAAFAIFDARGEMSHSLDDPILGAPALAADETIEPAVARALQALRDFEAHRGPLAPHFAYGALDKSQYTRAHLMHLANHWTELKTT